MLLFEIVVILFECSSLIASFMRVEIVCILCQHVDVANHDRIWGNEHITGYVGFPGPQYNPVALPAEYFVLGYDKGAVQMMMW